MADAKQKKPGRVPRLFQVRIPGRQFQRKILRRVYTTGDREFLLALYREGADGSRERTGEPSADDVKRLQSLAKSIAANRGAVQVPKLVILAVIVAAVVAFNLFFKNALMTRALQSGLQSAFGARAEVAGLDFRPLRGRISIARIAVADRDRPLRNLFEMGRTVVSIDTLRIFEGRFLVRSLECRNVSWDTPRKTSGALPVAAGAAGAAGQAAPAPQAEAAPGSTLADRAGAAAGSLLAAIDIPGLIDEQADELASIRRVTETNARLSAQVDKWQAEVGASRTEVDALAPRIETIRSFDYGSVRSLADAREVLEAIRAAAPLVQSLSGRVSATAGGLAADVKAAAAERAAIEAAITADVAYVKARVSLSPDSWKSLASGMAARVLEKYLGPAAAWVPRAWDAVEGLRRRAAEKKPKPLARRGRTVQYPGTALPRFLLSSAVLSLAGQPGVPDVEASLRDITSDPDILERPATVRASATMGGQALSLEGILDARSSRPFDASVSVEADNWDLAFREGLEKASISSLSGTAGMRLAAVLDRGGVQGQGRLSVRGMALELITGGDPLASAAADALRTVPEALVDFTFAVPREGPASVTVTTNLDAALAQAMSGQAAKLASQYEGQVRGELAKRLEAGLRENDGLGAGLASLQKAAGADLARAGSYSKVLQDAQRELEKRLKAAIPLPKLRF